MIRHRRLTWVLLRNHWGSCGVNLYWNGSEKYADKYPFRLFEYQRQLLKEGLFDAYNEWAFGATMGLASFQSWTAQHADDYNRFINFQKGRVFKLPPGQNYRNLSTK